MTASSYLSRAFGVAAVALLLFSASPARASGITLGKFGGIFGHPNTSGGLALYWNPARISMQRGAFGTIDATLISRAASYDRVIYPTNPYYDAPGVQETNTGLATTSTLAVLPYAAIGGAFDVDDIRLGLAAGIHPAYGGSATWDKRTDMPAEYPGAVDGPQRWSGISSSFVILHYVAGASVTWPELGLSFGVSLAVADGDIETVRARNVNRGEELLDARGVIQEGRIYFTGNDTALSLGLGASFENETVSASMNFRSGYNLHISGDLLQAYGTQDEIQIPAFLDFPTPHVFQTAITLRFGRAEITGVTDYSTWSRMEQNLIFVDRSAEGQRPDQLLEIPRNLQDTFSVRMLLGMNVNPRWNASIMLGMDPSAVPENTVDAALADALKVQLGAGFRARLSDHVRLLGSYAYDFYNTVESTESLHEPTTNGTYRDRRHYLNISFEGRL